MHFDSVALMLTSLFLQFVTSTVCTVNGSAKARRGGVQGGPGVRTPPQPWAKATRWHQRHWLYCKLQLVLNAPVEHVLSRAEQDAV